MKKILLLPGDGIGPEVIEQGRKMLEILKPHIEKSIDGSLEISKADFGGAAIDKHGTPLPDETLRQAKEADAVLLGAVGGPQYDSLPPEKRPETGLLRLRKELDVYVNLRPVRVFDSLRNSSSLKEEFVKRVDIIIVRELTGGIYFGEPRGIEGEGEERYAYNTMGYSVEEIRRITNFAFTLALRLNKKSLCSVDKANVLEVSRLWREVVNKIAQEKKYSQVNLSHMYVDNAAMQLVRNPKQFDVILTSNMFGDILSDLASQISGSIGMLPSCSFGKGPSLCEPIHGSAPDIAGQDLANPSATFLSLGMMCAGLLRDEDLRKKIHFALDQTLEDGMRTRDIALPNDNPVSCSKFGAAVIDNLRLRLK